MKPYEITRDGLLISTDKQRLDRSLIHRFLSQESYWAKDIPAAVVNRSIEHSLCFGLYRADRQIGFARVVSDFATFAWLSDVFIVEDQRGSGAAKVLIAAIMAHPELQQLRRFMLATADAHGLYQQFGFAPIKQVERFMEIYQPNAYK